MTNATRTDIKRVLLANVKDAPYGLLGFHRQTDNDTELLYDCDGVSVAISRKYEVFEVIGLNDDDFAELKKYYRMITQCVRVSRRTTYGMFSGMRS